MPANPKDKKSATVRESLLALIEAGIKSDPRLSLLDEGKPPQGFDYLWTIFWEVRGGASEGYGGIRVTWRDLADYQAVTGIDLDAFEVEAIMAMDAAVHKAVAESGE